jgi:hypothetical protein
MTFFITLYASCENLCLRAVTTGPVKKSLKMAFGLICPYTYGRVLGQKVG